jgi:predicted RNA-binding Zn-ribbon protein involved in translation (DUF1610 family)
METLCREVRLAASAISGVSLPFHRSSNRHTVELPCPNCGKVLRFKQGNRANSIKGIRCKECDARLLARNDEKRGTYLTPRIPVEERYECPSCGAEGTLPLDPAPSGVASGTCPQCGQGLTLTRTADYSVRVRPLAHPSASCQPITGELMERIRTRLPKQPWPTGVHREVAAELGISPSVVSRAIQELIKTGEFYPQENGVVLHPDRPKIEGSSLKPV